MLGLYIPAQRLSRGVGKIFFVLASGVTSLAVSLDNKGAIGLFSKKLLSFSGELQEHVLLALIPQCVYF